MKFQLIIQRIYSEERFTLFLENKDIPCSNIVILAEAPSMNELKVLGADMFPLISSGTRIHWCNDDDPDFASTELFKLYES